MSANDRQVGGDHYKKGGEEHWDRAWRLRYDPFQYIITKWVERWRDKGGIEDLKKARHAIDKYIEVAESEQHQLDGVKAGAPVRGKCDQKCPKCGAMFDKRQGFHLLEDTDRLYCCQCAEDEIRIFTGDAGTGYVNQDR